MEKKWTRAEEIARHQKAHQATDLMWGVTRKVGGATLLFFITVLAIVIVLLSALGAATIAYAQEIPAYVFEAQKQVPVLKEKFPVGIGNCYLTKKDTMSRAEGVPTPCIAYVDIEDGAHVWFAVLDSANAPTHVFEGDILAETTRLVWKKGQLNI